MINNNGLINYMFYIGLEKQAKKRSGDIRRATGILQGFHTIYSLTYQMVFHHIIIAC